MKYFQFNCIDVTEFQQLIKDSGLRHEMFTKHLGMTYATWQTRREQPERLTVQELIIIAEAIRLEPNELLQAILNDRNA